MKWPSALVVAFCVLAASCSPPATPAEWQAARDAPGGLDDADIATCNEMRDLALGSHADDDDLIATLEEMARISAVVGATSALPLLDRVLTTLDEDGELADVHDDLVAAAASIDTASYGVCGMPLFTATYAATGWPACHGELVIPVAGYTTLGAPGCATDAAPTFLPCFAPDAPHLPVDCNTGEVVQLVAGDWVAAGDPRVVTAPTTTTTTTRAPASSTTTTVPTWRYVASPACRSVARLFTGPDPVDGGADDLPRLRAAAVGLGREVRALVDDFIAVNTGALDVEEFDRIVATLDEATVQECGLPIVSAWDALAGGTDEAPCWVATGLAFPAFTPVDCDT